MDRFSRFVLLKERPPEGSSWSGGRLTTKQKNLVLMMCGQICENLCPMQQEESKTKMGYRETKLDNARHKREIFFIEPNDEGFKLTNENRSQKVGSSDACSNALQNTDKEQWRNPPQYWETQDEIRLCC